MARYTYKPAFYPFRAGDYEGNSRDPYNPGGITRDTDATSAVFNWTHIFGPSAFMEVLDGIVTRPRGRSRLLCMTLS